jgi:hypothetical protein
MENISEVPQKIKLRTNSNPTLGRYPKEIRSLSQRDYYIPTFTAALFLNIKGNNLNCLDTICKQMSGYRNCETHTYEHETEHTHAYTYAYISTHTYTMSYYSIFKKKQFLLYETNG